MSRSIRGLTLRQPWPSAICHLGKDVENRTWPPPRGTVGGYVAIHAGAVVDVPSKDDLLDALRFGTRPELNLPEHFDLLGNLTRSAIVAVARVAGVAAAQAPPRRGWSGPPPVASTWGDVPSTWSSPWFTGPFGWVLDDVVPLANPIRCKGRQGLWHLPPDLLVAVRAEYSRSRSAA